MFDELSTAIAGMRELGASDDQILDWMVLVEQAGKQAAGCASTRKLNLVVFEDNETVGEGIANVLQQLGHNVRWFIGELSPKAQPLGESLSAATPATTCDKPQTQSVTAENVDLVLLDYMLWGNHNGPDLLRYFHKRGVPVIAISGDPDCNNELVKQGASVGVVKHRILSALLSELDLQAIAARRS